MAGEATGVKSKSSVEQPVSNRNTMMHMISIRYSPERVIGSLRPGARSFWRAAKPPVMIELLFLINASFHNFKLIMSLVVSHNVDYVNIHIDTKFLDKFQVRSSICKHVLDMQWMVIALSAMELSFFGLLYGSSLSMPPTSKGR